MGHQKGHAIVVRFMFLEKVQSRGNLIELKTTNLKVCIWRNYLSKLKER